MDYSKRAHSDPSKWVCIYPLFLNSNKTVREGRVISKNLACENPTSKEIYNILSGEGLNVIEEPNKMHPLHGSHLYYSQGRVRVQLKNDDGSFCNQKFKSRKDIFIRAAEGIRNMKDRQVPKKVDPWSIFNSASPMATSSKVKGKKK
uniref:Signal recognition particle 19 kDa protein n=1 Tax=Strongyloides papillosus TaxID=174720 RepID=A0A0N5B2D7_STREA